MSSCLSTFSILFLEDCSGESLILSGAACLAPANCTPNSHSILEAICCGSPQRHGKNNYNYTASFFCTVRDDVLAASLLLLGHCTRTNVMCDVCFVCVCRCVPASLSFLRSPARITRSGFTQIPMSIINHGRFHAPKKSIKEPKVSNKHPEFAAHWRILDSKQEAKRHQNRGFCFSCSSICLVLSLPHSAVNIAWPLAREDRRWK